MAKSLFLLLVRSLSYLHPVNAFLINSLPPPLSALPLRPESEGILCTCLLLGERGGGARWDVGDGNDEEKAVSYLIMH